MYKRKLLIMLGVIVTLVITLVLFRLFTTGPPKELVASDLVATNLQFTHELSQTDGEVVFFTGTSVAKLVVDPGKPVESSSLTKDVALNSVDKISHSEFATVVRAYYKQTDSLLPLDNNNQLVKSLKDGQNWFIIDSSSKIQPVPFANQTSLVDCIVDGKDVYAIVNNNGGKQELIKYDLRTNKTKSLSSDYPASSFVGASKGLVVFRDYGGNVYLFKDGRAMLVEKNVGEASFDNRTGNLVLSHVAKEAVGEEGGVTTKSSSTSDKQHDYQLTIYNVFGGTREQLNLKTALYFVSNGYILSAPSLNGPVSLNTYNLATKKEHTIKVDQSKTKVVDQIKDMVVINGNLSLVAIITNFNQLVLYGTGDFVSGIPQYTFPKFNNNKGEFGFNHNIVTNKLLIYYRNKSTSVVNKSIAYLKEVCACDANQFEKKWQPETM